MSKFILINKIDENDKSSSSSGYRKTGQRGKVVNAEKWSMRKSGQRGKVVNGKLATWKKPKNAKYWLLTNNFEIHKF
jgi:hypothetical protein